MFWLVRRRHAVGGAGAAVFGAMRATHHNRAGLLGDRVTGLTDAVDEAHVRLRGTRRYGGEHQDGAQEQQLESDHLRSPSTTGALVMRSPKKGVRKGSEFETSPRLHRRLKPI